MTPDRPSQGHRSGHRPGHSATLDPDLRPDVGFDQWATAVRQQMVAALKRRGNI